MKEYSTIAYLDQINPPIDRNDPAAAATARELRFPPELGERAQRVLEYFGVRTDASTAFLYSYKGRLVVTDESFDLTPCGDGTPGNPFGCPRWTGDTMEELESWLEDVADELDEDDAWD